MFEQLENSQSSSFSRASITSSFLESILENEQNLEYEQLLEIIGDQHKYQYRMIFFTGIFFLVAGLQFYSFIFLFLAPTFICPTQDLKPNQIAINYQVCSEGYHACKNEIILGNTENKSIALDFQLYCDQRYLRYIILQLFFIGGEIYLFYDARIILHMTLCLTQIIAVVINLMMENWIHYFIFIGIIPSSMISLILFTSYIETPYFMFTIEVEKHRNQQNYIIKKLFNQFSLIAQINDRIFFTYDQFKEQVYPKVIQTFIKNNILPQNILQNKQQQQQDQQNDSIIPQNQSQILGFVPFSDINEEEDFQQGKIFIKTYNIVQEINGQDDQNNKVLPKEIDLNNQVIFRKDIDKQNEYFRRRNSTNEDTQISKDIQQQQKQNSILQFSDTNQEEDNNSKQQQQFHQLEKQIEDEQEQEESKQDNGVQQQQQQFIQQQQNSQKQIYVVSIQNEESKDQIQNYIVCKNLSINDQEYKQQKKKIINDIKNQNQEMFTNNNQNIIDNEIISNTNQDTKTIENISQQKQQDDHSKNLSNNNSNMQNFLQLHQTVQEQQNHNDNNPIQVQLHQEHIQIEPQQQQEQEEDIQQQQEHQIQNQNQSQEEGEQEEQEQLQNKKFYKKQIVFSLLSIIQFSLYFGMYFILSDVALELGFNIIIISIAEMIAVLVAERFIDFPNPISALSYNLIVSGFILLSFNMTFDSISCREQFTLFCPEKILQILLIGASRFSNIFSISFLIRYFKIDFYLEKQRVQTWENFSTFGIIGAIISLQILMYTDNIYKYMSLLSIMAFVGSVITKKGNQI